LYIYVRRSSLDRPDVAKFIEFYLANVHGIAPRVGYVPVTDDIAMKNQAVLDAARGKTSAF
jgi:phosphate transport system substrate-binding protein